MKKLLITLSSLLLATSAFTARNNATSETVAEANRVVDTAKEKLHKV